MLIAKTESGERIEARVAEKGQNYYCQISGEKVILKKGELKIHHFAHYPGSECVHWESESGLHYSMKYKILEELCESNNVNMIELEYPVYDEFGMLVPDVYAELEDGVKVAFECQISHKHISAILAKTIRYSRMGIHTLWIFSSNELLGTERQYIRLPSMEREVHNIIGDLFVIDNNKFGVLNLVRDGKLKTMFYCKGNFIDKPVLNTRVFNTDISDIALQERKDINLEETNVKIKPLVLKEGESYHLRLREVWLEEDKLYMIVSEPFADSKIYLLAYIPQESMHRVSYELSDGWHLKEKFRNARGMLKKVSDNVITWQREHESDKDTKTRKVFKDLILKDTTCNLLISDFKREPIKSDVKYKSSEHIMSSPSLFIDEDDLSLEIPRMHKAGMSISDMALYCDVSAGVIYDCIRKNNIILE